MKGLSVVFGMSVLGILVSFVMSVYTVIQNKSQATQAVSQTAPATIPLPAE